MNTINKKQEDHMKNVESAISKINNNESIENLEIREVLKSLMNGQIFLSEKQEELEKKIKLLEFWKKEK